MTKKLFLVCSLLLGSAWAIQAQTPATNGDANAAAAPVVAITAASTPIELAHAALTAQGGEKFRTMKSMMLIGTVDLYQPNSTQSIPGKFAIVYAGDKFRIEIDARPIMAFKQVYDGQQSYSSVPAIQLPPATNFGPPVLAKLDQGGYTTTAIPDKKKLRGFRIVDAGGNTTDFYIDPANGQVVSFLIYYQGNTFGTENLKQKVVEGILVPMKFSQSLQLTGAGTFFAEYTVKDVKINQPVGDDVFTNN